MLDRKLYRIINVLNKEYFYKYSVYHIIVQKALYLLTHGKTNPKLTLPYKWSFYLRGPYSSEIAHMIYYMIDYLPSLDKSRIQLDEEEIKAITHFQDFRKALLSIDEEINEEDLFEMITIIVYISEQVNRSKIEQKFYEFKPELKNKISKKKFKIILNKLSEFGYI